MKVPSMFSLDPASLRHVMLAIACALSATGAAAQDKAQFLLDLIPSGEYAAYYAGVAKGFFKEQNIDLSISRGFGSGDTVAKVAAGAAPFGIADIGPALAARAKANAPVKVISSMYVFSPHSMFVLESSGIKNLKELSGKRIGITPGNSHRLYFPEVAKRIGIDESKVEWVNVDASSMATLLISKRLDAVPFFAIHHYYMNKAAQAHGEKINVLPYVATGFTIYSSALLTNENTAKNNPDLVKRFLAGAWKSVKWARDNVNEACALHVKANPEVKQDDCVGSLTAVNSYVFNDFSAKSGMGKFDAARSEQTWQQVVKAQELNPSFNYKQVLDTSFLPANN
jgi:NitT/TauT family transport system substrate-binding protein